jgi:hypothetical protein
MLMAANVAPDPLTAIREAGTAAPNFDLDNEAIINHLAQWQSLCEFNIKSADHDRAEIEFVTLPADMDAFVRDLYEFCPDLVDQGTGCVHEMVEAMEEMGEDLPPETARLVEGIDLSDENYGLEILKRELAARKSVTLWWD